MTHVGQVGWPKSGLAWSRGGTGSFWSGGWAGTSTRCRLLAHMGLIREKLRRLVEGRRDASSTSPPTDSHEHTTAATHRLGSTGFLDLPMRSSLAGSLGRAERQSTCRATPTTSFSRYSTLLLDRSVQPVERRAKQARKWSRRRPRSAGLTLRVRGPHFLEEGLDISCRCKPERGSDACPHEGHREDFSRDAPRDCRQAVRPSALRRPISRRRCGTI